MASLGLPVPTAHGGPGAWEVGVGGLMSLGEAAGELKLGDSSPTSVKELMAMEQSTLFWKEPGGTYLRIWGPHSLCPQCSALPQMTGQW